MYRNQRKSSTSDRIEYIVSLNIDFIIFYKYNEQKTSRFECKIKLYVNQILFLVTNVKIKIKL